MSAMGQKRTSVSFDYFIRTQQECLCDLQSKRLGGARIDDKVELDWLLDRQVGRLFVGLKSHKKLAAIKKRGLP
jgi:hypothetical protein